MIDTRVRNPQSLAAFLFVVVLVSIFLCGILVAAAHSLPADASDPGGMPPWLAGMVSALNTAFAANLGVELGKRFSHGRFPTKAERFSHNWNLFWLGITYTLAWIVATAAWILNGYEASDKIVAVLPEVSTKGMEIFAGLAVVLMAAQSASKRVRAWFD